MPITPTETPIPATAVPTPPPPSPTEVPPPTATPIVAERLPVFGTMLPGRTYSSGAFILTTPPGHYALKTYSVINDPGSPTLVCVTEATPQSSLKLYWTGKEAGRFISDPAYIPIFDAIMATMVVHPELQQITSGDVALGGEIYRYGRLVFTIPGDAEFQQYRVVEVNEAGQSSLLFTSLTTVSTLLMSLVTGLEISRAPSEYDDYIFDEIVGTSWLSD